MPFAHRTGANVADPDGASPGLDDGRREGAPPARPAERPAAESERSRTVRPSKRRCSPTTVVGSYSVPEWLERLKTDYYQRRISGAYLQEIHEVAIKAALKDQEQAGVDDRLGRRAAARQRRRLLPGAHARRRDPAPGQGVLLRLLRRRRPPPAARRTTRPTRLGLVDDLRFTREYTDQPDQVLADRAVLAVAAAPQRGLRATRPTS